MPGEVGERVDFFLSRRGSVAAVAQEVSDVLTGSGYKVIVQDYDIRLAQASLTRCTRRSRTRATSSSFSAGTTNSRPTPEKSSPASRPSGCATSGTVTSSSCVATMRRFGAFWSTASTRTSWAWPKPEERKRRILAAAERRSSAERPQRRRGRRFVGVPPRIAGFTGRADELDRAAVTQVGRAAVQGMGGVGKTTLAVEYANRFRNLYDGVWWCSAETRAGLLTSLSALAKELEVASPDEADIEKAARAALRRLAEQGDIWLVVYDNLATPADIADLLPAAGVRALITSRFSDWGGWADEVSLDVLPLDEAIAFLMDRAARDDEAGARTLAEALGRLPLARSTMRRRLASGRK
jgi:hypothetical protein